MKKLFVVWVTILFTVSILALPVMAAVVLQEKIIPCGEPATIHGCGNKNPIASDPLKDGKVTVMDNGAVTVELKGAAVKATYHVYVGVWGGIYSFLDLHLQAAVVSAQSPPIKMGTIAEPLSTGVGVSSFSRPD